MEGSPQHNVPDWEELTAQGNLKKLVDKGYKVYWHPTRKCADALHPSKTGIQAAYLYAGWIYVKTPVDPQESQKIQLKPVEAKKAETAQVEEGGEAVDKPKTTTKKKSN